MPCSDFLHCTHKYLDLCGVITMYKYEDFLKDNISILNKTGVLYLYCSNQVLFEILNSSELWLTDSSFMNDTKELILFDNIFNTTIDDMKNNKIISDNECSLIHDSYEWFIAGHNSFFSCFSRQRDSLTLWERYGDNAQGVAIGFSISKLNIRKCPTVYEFPILQEDKQLGMLPVQYFDSNNKNKIYEMIKHAVLSARKDLDGDKYDGFVPEDYYRSEILPLCGLRDIIKSHHFREEDEIRIIFNEWEDTEEFKNKIKGTDNRLSGCYYRVVNNSIQKYYKLKIDVKDCLEEVVLGVHNKTKTKDLKFLLMNMGLNAKVNSSVISYIPK